MHPSSSRLLRRFCLPDCALGRLVLIAFSVALAGWGSLPSARAATQEERRPESAAFNRDATLIVYVDKVTPSGELLPKTGEIWTVYPDGRGKHRLTAGHQDKSPRFSPDSKHIIFERDGDGEIWIMNIEGGEVHNLTNTPKVYEHDAQFSNTGDSLFLLAPSPPSLTAQDLANEPLLALGTVDVLVQLNLKDGTRRPLLDENYAVRMVFPDPDKDQVALVLCNRIEANGQPAFFGDKAIVAVPLDGGASRNVYSAPQGYALEMARAGGKYLVVSATSPGQGSAQVFFLKQDGANTATATDLKKLEKFTFFGDISFDGTTLIGTTTGLNTTTGHFYSRIETYDIATEKWRTVLEE